MQQYIPCLLEILDSILAASEEEEVMIAGCLLNDVESDDGTPTVFQSVSPTTKDIILAFQDVVDDIYMSSTDVTPVDLATELKERGYSVHDLVDDAEVTWTHYINLPCGQLRF